MNREQRSKVSKWSREVEARLRGPVTCFLPPYVLTDLWEMARARGEDPRETASYLIQQQLYPDVCSRKRRLREWRREIWSRGRGLRPEMAA